MVGGKKPLCCCSVCISMCRGQNVTINLYRVHNCETVADISERWNQKLCSCGSSPMMWWCGDEVKIFHNLEAIWNSSIATETFIGQRLSYSSYAIQRIECDLVCKLRVTSCAYIILLHFVFWKIQNILPMVWLKRWNSVKFSSQTNFKPMYLHLFLFATVTDITAISKRCNFIFNTNLCDFQIYAAEINSSCCVSIVMIIAGKQKKEIDFTFDT